MPPLRSNKTFVRSLLMVLLCVWGAVAYQVIDTVARMDADPSSSSTNASGRKGRAIYVYRADVPDPFARQLLWDPSREFKRKAAKAPKPFWTPPPITLAGILTHPRKATAVLLCPDGSTHFAAQGDTLLGARILKIRQGTVAYLYNKKKAEWVLP
jgi:hypothetical protein